MDIEEFMAQWKKDHEIRCPRCGELQPNDEGQWPVTYWAEDGATEMECCQCDERFWVEEHVDRTWKVVGDRE